MKKQLFFSIAILTVASVDGSQRPSFRKYATKPATQPSSVNVPSQQRQQLPPTRVVTPPSDTRTVPTYHPPTNVAPATVNSVAALQQVYANPTQQQIVDIAAAAREKADAIIDASGLTPNTSSQAYNDAMDALA
ncbi:MAG TPA: hypothetical protein VLG50_07075 [Candidatus Saccharimonadales bacterium]|nr:hypothetical protein [Candidatus Saccharimonadales bacterium]